MIDLGYSFCQVTIITKIAIHTTAKRDRNALQKVGGDKAYSVPPVPKVGGICPSVHPTIDAHGCARKYEQSKKRCFIVRKGSYTTFNIVKSGKRKRKFEKLGR